MKKGFKFLIALVCATLVISCTDDPKTPEQVDFTEANNTEISAFLAAENLQAQKTASGLYYVIDEQGNGSNPIASSTVRVAYKGYFTDGRVFDESAESGISFPLNRVIPGWTEGIPLFKEGGKGMLIIPSRLAYGNSGTRGIAPGSVLVFDINLLEVE